MVLKISSYCRPKNNKCGVSQKSIVSSCPLKEEIWSVAAPLAQNLEIEECLQLRMIVNQYLGKLKKLANQMNI